MSYQRICGHSTGALMDSWTCSAACCPANHNRPSPRSPHQPQ